MVFLSPLWSPLTPVVEVCYIRYQSLEDVEEIRGN